MINLEEQISLRKGMGRMREFKFRCFDKMEGYMLSWQDLLDGGDLEEMMKLGHEEDENYSRLMQYTGRKDKIGTEIYEGDIVEENGKLAVCTWFIEAGAYAFVPTELYPCELQKLIAYHAYDTFFENDIPETYVKIAGNIHENPELLEIK